MSSPSQAIVAQVHEFLEVPLEKSLIVGNLKESFPEPNLQLQAATIMLEFVKFFDMFRSLKALLKEVFKVIVATFDICEKIEDFRDLLVKSILLRITEIYIDNSKFSDKEKILKTLSQSLEILAPSALIINLGLLVKPVFSDPKYLELKAKEEELVIEVVDNSAVAQRIKSEIDRWIKQQSLDLDQQDEMHVMLEKEFERLATQNKIQKGTSEYEQILLECNEMMNLQLTALSLVMDLGDEDLAPIPL